MATFDVQLGDGYTYTVEGVETEAQAQAEAQKQADAQTKQDYQTEQAEPGLHFGAAGQTLMDLGNVGLQGMTFGYGDDLKAGIISGITGGNYEDQLAAEAQKLRQAKIRMNEETPYSSQVFEGLSGAAAPLGAANKLGILKPALKYGGTAAAMYGINKLGGDPMSVMAGYAGRDILSKLLRR